LRLNICESLRSLSFFAYYRNFTKSTLFGFYESLNVRQISYIICDEYVLGFSLYCIFEYIYLIIILHDYLLMFLLNNLVKFHQLSTKLEGNIETRINLK
jgi:hypothetical protein